MNIHILSDIHVEFAPFTLPKTDADVLVLAGDIGTGTMGVGWACQYAHMYRAVVYVAGNHEYYHQRFPSHFETMVQASIRNKPSSPVIVLNNASTIIDGVRFLGTTLWTDG